jgi:YVTN family beta-propeller protein
MKIISRLTHLFLLSALPVMAGTSRIYVLNNHGTTIDVIDPATNKVVQTIQNIPHSHGITFSHDGRHAYVTSETEDTLFELDTATGKTLRKVALSPGSANLPAVTKDGKRIYVCVNGVRDEQGNMLSSVHGFVDIVDVSSFTTIKTLPMKGGMHDCYTTPDGKYIVASSLGGKFLSVIDPNTNEILWTVNFNRGVTTSAFEVAKDGSTRRIFSGLAEYHGFAVIDFAAQKEVDRITLPEPNDFKLGGELERRNLQPTHGAAISPDAKTLWIVSRSSNGVFVYSLPDVKLMKYIPTPRNPAAQHPVDSGDPGWITFTPDGKTAYIPNAAVDSVSAIDTKTMKEVAVIPVGRQPDHVETLVISDK